MTGALNTCHAGIIQLSHLSGEDVIVDGFQLSHL